MMSQVLTFTSTVAHIQIFYYVTNITRTLCWNIQTSFIIIYAYRDIPCMVMCHSFYIQYHTLLWGKWVYLFTCMGSACNACNVSLVPKPWKDWESLGWGYGMLLGVLQQMEDFVYTRCWKHFVKWQIIS